MRVLDGDRNGGFSGLAVEQDYSAAKQLLKSPRRVPQGLKTTSLRDRDKRSLIHATGQNPSVDRQHVACDKARGLGCQEHSSTDKFFDLAETAHRRSH